MHGRDGHATLIVYARRTNRSYSIDWTVDFNGWTNLTNITLTSPTAPVTNPSTNAAARFYRARLVP